METIYIRGNAVRYKGKYPKGEFIYVDNGEKVPNSGIELRPCPKCGVTHSFEDHDHCIKNLPGVKNACCGHGDRKQAYIQFDNGFIIREFIVDSDLDREE